MKELPLYLAKHKRSLAREFDVYEMIKEVAQKKWKRKAMDFSLK